MLHPDQNKTKADPYPKVKASFNNERRLSLEDPIVMHQRDLTVDHPPLQVSTVEIGLEPVGLQLAGLAPVHHAAPHFRQLGELPARFRHHLSVREQPDLSQKTQLFCSRCKLTLFSSTKLHTCQLPNPTDRFLLPVFLYLHSGFTDKKLL
jgi:hypothetical protein